MGCAPVKKKTPLQRKESPIGVLKISILGVKFFINDSLQDTEVLVRVSNQVQKFQNLAAPSRGKQKDQKNLLFAINSFYKPHGRTIDIAYLSRKLLIAAGSVDANPIIDKRDTQELRCILHHNGDEQYGFVLIRCIFEDTSFQEISFRFLQATIRRTKQRFGTDNVAVRLTMGEQSLETQFQPDQPNNPPSWKDRNYNFKVPTAVKRGQLELFDDRGDVIGSSDLKLDNYTQAKQGEETFQSQSLFFKEGDDPIATAALKFSYIVGKNAIFKSGELDTSAIRSVRPGAHLVDHSLSKSLSHE